MAKPLRVADADIAEMDGEDTPQPSADLVRLLEAMERPVLFRKGPSRQPTPVGMRDAPRPFAYD